MLARVESVDGNSESGVRFVKFGSGISIEATSKKGANQIFANPDSYDTGMRKFTWRAAGTEHSRRLPNAFHGAFRPRRREGSL